MWKTDIKSLLLILLSLWGHILVAQESNKIADSLLFVSNNLTYPQNVATLRSAIDLYEKDSNCDIRQNYSVALNNLAIALQNIDIEESIVLERRVLRNKRLCSFGSDTITTMATLSYFFKENEQIDSSFYYNNIVLSYRKKYLSHYDERLYNTYINTASLYARIGEFDSALTYAKRARRIAKKKLGLDQVSRMDQSIGSYYWMKGDFFKAISITKKACEHNKHSIVNLIGMFAEIGEIDSSAYYLNIALNQIIADQSEVLFYLNEKDKFHYVRNGENNALISLPIHYCYYYNNDGFNRIGYNSILYRRRLNLMNDIQGIDIVSWEQVASSLEKNEVAVEIWDNRDVSLMNNDSILVFVLRNGWSAPKLIRLNKLSLEKALSGSLETTETKRPMYDFFWKEIIEVGEIEIGDNIYIALDGLLPLFPVEIICDYDWNYVCDKYNIHRVSTTANILKIKEVKGFQKIVLYGGIEYERTSNAKYESGSSDSIEASHVSFENNRSRFSYLPGTLKEVQEIKDLLEPAMEVQLLTGRDGTEESFYKLSEDAPDIVHFATHGAFVIDDLLSFADEYEFREASYNNSFLILASSLDGSNSHKKDGILTGQEIESINLSGVDLVVLSACKTGVGAYMYDGIIGLQRAFMRSGVKSIVMSLWNIDDAVTSIFMNIFYLNLHQGKTKYESLKLAQKAIRNLEADLDPTYWAGFVLID